MLTVSIPDDDSRTATTDGALTREEFELEVADDDSRTATTDGALTSEDCELEIADDNPQTVTTDGALTSKDCELSPLSCFVAITGPPSSESIPTNVKNTFESTDGPIGVHPQLNVLSHPEFQTLSPTEINIDYDYINLINTLHKAFINDRYDYTSTLMQHIQNISCDNAKKVYCKLYILIDNNFDRKKFLIDDDDCDYIFINTLTADQIKRFVNRYINIGTFFEY